MIASKAILAELNETNAGLAPAEHREDKPLPLDGLAELEESDPLGSNHPDQFPPGSPLAQSLRDKAEGSLSLRAWLTPITSQRRPPRRWVVPVLLSCLAMFGLGWRQGAGAIEVIPSIRVGPHEGSPKNVVVTEATFTNLDVRSTGRSADYLGTKESEVGK